MVDEGTLINNAIAWNVGEFYRALKDGRLDDAKRFKGNVERLEELEKL